MLDIIGESISLRQAAVFTGPPSENESRAAARCTVIVLGKSISPKPGAHVAEV